MSLRERWWTFHVANLHVYDALKSLALDLKRAGYNRCGIGLLWERLRWESYLQTQGQGPYKLSNSHRALYARFLMARELELVDFFEVRNQPSEEDKDES